MLKKNARMRWLCGFHSLKTYNTCMYRTPVDIHKYNGDIPNVCLKCINRGTLVCGLVKKKKKQYSFGKRSKWCWEKKKVNVLLWILSFLLRLYPERHNYMKSEWILLDIGLLIAKWCIYTGRSPTDQQKTEENQILNCSNL